MSNEAERRPQPAVDSHQRTSGEVQTETIDGIPTVIVSGEFDLVLAAAAAPQLNAAIRSGADAVLIDLSAVEFIDSSGLVLLLSTYRLLDRADRKLAIVCPNRSAHRILALTRLDRVLPIHDTRDQALAALQAPSRE